MVVAGRVGIPRDGAGIVSVGADSGAAPVAVVGPELVLSRGIEIDGIGMATRLLIFFPVDDEHLRPHATPGQSLAHRDGRRETGVDLSLDLALRILGSRDTGGQSQGQYGEEAGHGLKTLALRVPLPRSMVPPVSFWKRTLTVSAALTHAVMAMPCRSREKLASA